MVTEDGQMLEISDLESRGGCAIYKAKTKTLISCAVTAQLIYVFVFAYVKRRFSPDTAVGSRAMTESANKKKCFKHTFWVVSKSVNLCAIPDEGDQSEVIKTRPI